jgi:hypothetical protein
MLADGAHRMERAIAAPGDQDRLSADLRRQAIARRGHLLDPADAVPGAAEDLLLLEGEELGLGVAARRHHAFGYRGGIEAGDLGQQSRNHGGPRQGGWTAIDDRLIHGLLPKSAGRLRRGAFSSPPQLCWGGEEKARRYANALPETG